MQVGIVKCYFPNKGFGFIKPDAGKDLFVHATELKKAKIELLNQGDKIAFEIDQDPVDPATGQPLNKGPRAVNLSIVN